MYCTGKNDYQKKKVKIFYRCSNAGKTFGNAELGKHDIPDVMWGTSFKISAKSTLLTDRI